MFVFFSFLFRQLAIFDLSLTAYPFLTDLGTVRTRSRRRAASATATRRARIVILFYPRFLFSAANFLRYLFSHRTFCSHIHISSDAFTSSSAGDERRSRPDPISALRSSPLPSFHLGEQSSPSGLLLASAFRVQPQQSLQPRTPPEPTHSLTSPL